MRRPARDRRSPGDELGRSERGSVSVLVAGVVAALLVVSMGAADVARILHAASEAQTAADAAALAAAQALAIDEEEGPSPEDLAREYAARNRAVLETCVCERGTFAATVSVHVVIGGLFVVPGERRVVARARAQVDLPVG